MSLIAKIRENNSRGVLACILVLFIIHAGFIAFLIISEGGIGSFLLPDDLKREESDKYYLNVSFIMTSLIALLLLITGIISDNRGIKYASVITGFVTLPLAFQILLMIIAYQMKLGPNYGYEIAAGFKVPTIHIQFGIILIIAVISYLAFRDRSASKSMTNSS